MYALLGVFFFAFILSLYSAIPEVKKKKKNEIKSIQRLYMILHLKPANYMIIKKGCSSVLLAHLKFNEFVRNRLSVRYFK